MTMTKVELEALHSYIDSSRNYLEFGAGESTIYASTAPIIETIDSVESSEDFINENLKSNAAIASAIDSGKLLFHIIDIGETGNWGFPINESKKHLWPNYSLSVFSKKNNHDLALVDGRFRVACALNCILNTPDECIIMIHDFFRPEYHIVLKYLEIKEQIDTLGIFTKNNHKNIKEIQSLIKKFQYLPGDKTLFFRAKHKLKYLTR